MPVRVCISGSGVVSAIGVGKKETLQALLAGQRGLDFPRYLQTKHKELPLGEVKRSNQEMKASLGIPAQEVVPRTALMGMLAVQEALEEAGDIRAFRPAFISGTTVGGMDISEQLPPEQRHPELWDCGACSNAIAGHFGLFGSVITPSTACSSAANALLLGARLIRAGQCDVVVAGGAECLTIFHLNGFRSLMIVDAEPCRPFDQSRAGLNLGEGAAYVVLESEQHALERGAKPQAYLDGWENACDAYHQTASSPEGEGAYLAMQQALQVAGLKPADIGYVNAHGTGTPNNDESESRALQRLFGTNIPPISSTKGFTGHTTSASGSIEAVFCILALQKGFIPGNPGFQTPFEGGIVPQKEAAPAPALQHVLCNAFGFGGNDSSLLISKVL